jgi:hypothetical protein
MNPAVIQAISSLLLLVEQMTAQLQVIKSNAPDLWEQIQTTYSAQVQAAQAQLLQSVASGAGVGQVAVVQGEATALSAEQAAALGVNPEGTQNAPVV